MDLGALIRKRIKAARTEGALWVRVLDVARLLPTSEGRSSLWTRVIHAGEVHQTTPETAENRHPELFDFVARLAPSAERILSFGCSTGEELVSLRRRFRSAEIVGAEINPRSRRIAAERVAKDERISVQRSATGTFDVIFALAVFEREPRKMAEMDVRDLSPYYPFARFDDGVSQLVRLLRRNGLLCVSDAHYRVEDSSISHELEPVAGSPMVDTIIFGADGKRLEWEDASKIFRKLC